MSFKLNDARILCTSPLDLKSEGQLRRDFECQYLHLTMARMRRDNVHTCNTSLVMSCGISLDLYCNQRFRLQTILYRVDKARQQFLPIQV